MPRFAMLVLTGSLSLTATWAQAAPQTGHVFCTVTDSSGIPARIWASPVLPVQYASNDAGGFNRSMELAGEFMAHVTQLGGQGSKSCNVLPTQSEAMALYQEQHALWDKRSYFIRIGDWRDVAWTPKAWTQATTASAQALIRHFHCYAIQTDLPDSSALSRTLNNAIFARPVPGNRVIEASMEQSSTYTRQFQQVVQANGMPVSTAFCMYYDTPAEAQYAWAQTRRQGKGFNQKYTELNWQPGAKDRIATPSPVAVATPATTPAVTPATTPPISTARPQAGTARPAVANPGAATASPTQQALFCTGAVTRSKPSLQLRAPAWQVPGPQSGLDSLADMLGQLHAAAMIAYPGEWRSLPQISCHTGPGPDPETFCHATDIRKFTGNLQQVAMWCNTSREKLRPTEAMLDQAGGPDAIPFHWTP